MTAFRDQNLIHCGISISVFITESTNLMSLLHVLKGMYALCSFSILILGFVNELLKQIFIVVDRCSSSSL